MFGRWRSNKKCLNYMFGRRRSNKKCLHYIFGKQRSNNKCLNYRFGGRDQITNNNNEKVLKYWKSLFVVCFYKWKLHVGILQLSNGKVKGVDDTISTRHHINTTMSTVPTIFLLRYHYCRTLKAALNQWSICYTDASISLVYFATCLVLNYKAL